MEGGLHYPPAKCFEGEMSSCSGLHRDSRPQAAGARHLAAPIRGISQQGNKRLRSQFSLCSRNATRRGNARSFAVGRGFSRRSAGLGDRDGASQPLTRALGPRPTSAPSVAGGRSRLVQNRSVRQTRGRSAERKLYFPVASLDAICWPFLGFSCADRGPPTFRSKRQGETFNTRALCHA